MDLTYSKSLPCPVTQRLKDSPGFEKLIWDLGCNVDPDGSLTSSKQVIEEIHAQWDTSLQKFLELKCLRDTIMQVLMDELDRHGCDSKGLANDIIEMFTVLDIPVTPPFIDVIDSKSIPLPVTGESHKEYIKSLMPKVSDHIMNLSRFIFGAILRKKKDKVNPTALTYVISHVKKDVDILNGASRRNYLNQLEVIDKIMIFKQNVNELLKKCYALESEITRSEYFCVKGNVLLSKLKVIELRLLLATYGTDQIKALQILHKYATEKNSNLLKEIREVEDFIKSFQERQDEFAPMVDKYKNLKKKLSSLEWTRDRMNEAGNQSLKKL